MVGAVVVFVVVAVVVVIVVGRVAAVDFVDVSSPCRSPGRRFW